MYNDFNDILNKKIKKITHNSDNLTFILADSSRVSYKAVGDCCSKSYIEDLDNPEIFNDSILLSVESESGQKKEISDWDIHKWTFYKFKTDKGMCTLSFRNESNGYYDGWLEKE